MKKLSKAEKAAKIEAIIADRDSTVKVHRAAMEQRMENYYNCLDDYSYGGICDQASQSAISAAERRAAMLIEQVKNDGVLNRTCDKLCLFDLEGNFVTDNVIGTKYGLAFLFDGKFVSLAKRQATYEKKGYVCKTRVREFEVVFTGDYSRRGNPIYREINLVSERYEDRLDGRADTAYLEYCYESRVAREKAENK